MTYNKLDSSVYEFLKSIRTTGLQSDRIPFPVSLKYAGRSVTAHQPCLGITIVDCWSIENVKVRMSIEIRTRLIKAIERGEPMPIGRGLRYYLHVPAYMNQQWQMLYVDVADLITRPSFIHEYEEPEEQKQILIPKRVVDLIVNDKLNLIAAWRVHRKYSQLELARKANLSIRTVMNIENDKSSPRKQTLQQLARALNVAIEQLS